MDEENGTGTGRLYGICVTHPRVVTSESYPSTAADAATTAGADSDVAFESSVCYAFISRFPLFDFFFQVLFDIITAERLYRMELLAADPSRSIMSTAHTLACVPPALHEEVLHRLSALAPPKYNTTIHFHTCPHILPIEKPRPAPSFDFYDSEHLACAAEWALAPLMSWMPLNLIVWTVGLLMGEAKVIVVGNEAGMVTSAVLGLLALLRPLDWVAPLIPILPLKHKEYIGEYHFGPFRTHRRRF